MGSKLDGFLTEGVSSSVFSRRTAYIVRYNAKKFTLVGLFYKDVILFLKNILRVGCSLRKIK